MNTELSKRLQSLCWSIGMMIVAMSIDWTAANLDLLNLSAEQTVFLGLFLAQMSKAIHNYLRQPKEETL
jgi:hypothetical protein